MKSPISYIPNFLQPFEAEYTFEKLMDIDWVQVPGRPRKEYWVSTRLYTYGSGEATHTYEPQPWPARVSSIRYKLANYSAVPDYYANNGCFLNRYDTSRDYLGWHADDSPEIDPAYPINVITLGQGRNIQFKPIGSGPDEIETVFLEPGSLLIMEPGMQQTHLHRIPKAGFVVKRPRISLTYRTLFD